MNDWQTAPHTSMLNFGGEGCYVKPYEMLDSLSTNRINCARFPLDPHSHNDGLGASPSHASEWNDSQRGPHFYKATTTIKFVSYIRN